MVLIGTEPPLVPRAFRGRVPFMRPTKSPLQSSARQDLLQERHDLFLYKVESDLVQPVLAL